MQFLLRNRYFLLEIEEKACSSTFLLCYTMELQISLISLQYHIIISVLQSHYYQYVYKD